MSATLLIPETTALATVAEGISATLGNPAEYTSAEKAAIVIKYVRNFRECIPFIISLKKDFDAGERDSTNRLREPIKDCHSWKEFCDMHLGKSDRRIRQVLAAAKPKLEAPHQATAADFAEYEQEHPDIRQITKNLLATMTPTDVAGALIGMNTPEVMAIAAVRFISGVLPAPESLAGMPQSLQEIQLEPCSRTDPRYEAIRNEHYIDNHGCIGQQVHFLIHYKGELVGIISGASAAYATKSRDQFFGINKGNRHGFLQGVVDNTVFRLENHEPDLATRVLRLWREIVPHIWYEKYGTVVYGFETFVVENDTRKGALYKADNWTFAGTTSGATKIRNGIENPADNWKKVVPKLVYCRWRDGFSTTCSARTPEWVQKMCGDVLRSSKEHAVEEFKYKIVRGNSNGN
jgi:Domain of unknown function (DUF4338)